MGFTNISACRGCAAHGRDLEVVLQMESMPLAGLFCASSDDARNASAFPLTWLLCHSCGLVQVSEDVHEDTLFREYRYASSTVPGLVRHFDSYADLLTR